MGIVLTGIVAEQTPVGVLILATAPKRLIKYHVQILEDLGAVDLNYFHLAFIFLIIQNQLHEKIN